MEKPAVFGQYSPSIALHRKRPGMSHYLRNGEVVVEVVSVATDNKKHRAEEQGKPVANSCHPRMVIQTHDLS